LLIPLTKLLELLHFVEKPNVFVSDLINCGVYIFSSEMLKKGFFNDLAKKYANILETNKDDTSLAK